FPTKKSYITVLDTRCSERISGTLMRLPPGQTLTTKWPVLHWSGVPHVTESSFRFKVFGAVDDPLELTCDELRALPSVKVTADFHCVTTWSRFDNAWEGVSWRT